MGITSFDFFDLPEMPNFILCSPNKIEMYALGGISERKYSPRFNALSEISFRADEYIDNILMPYYEFLVYRRLIYVQELGYFMISEVTEEGDGITKYKTIKCQSLEVELTNKKLSLFKGTYQFYNIISASSTLMGQILSYLPGWSVGTIDAAIAVKYRTFDESDTTIYNFLMTTVEQAFECVFLFDTVAKTISARTLPNATTATDIYISYDNLIEKITIEEATDNLVTALTVLGGGGLDINQVNPLGTNNIYDFTYFKDTDWMSQGLIDAITAWEALIVANQVTYANLLTNLSDGNVILLTLQSELDELNAQYAALEETRGAYIQEGVGLTSISGSIAAKQADIDNKTSDVNNQTATVNAIVAQLVSINETLSFDTNFTSAQQIELQPFIIQSSYINENFIQTDVMTAVQVQAQAQLLYDQAIGVLSRLSEPRYTFDVASVNFMMIKEFQNYIDEFVLGAIINLEVKDGVITYPVLLGMDLNYDNPTDFKLIFGNRLRLDDKAFQYSDLMNEALSAGTTTKVNSEQWNSWNNNYKDEVSTFITSSLDASLNNVISGSNQQILINSSGLRGRTISSGSQYSPEQLWMVNNMLAFTDNNWSTAKMAIGKIAISGSSSVYGIAADYLIGRVVASNQLTITNANAKFTVDALGATLTDATLNINSSDGLSQILIDPFNGIKIKTSIGGGAMTDRFYVDTAGNLIMAGNISATSGTIGGWSVASTGLSDSYGNYINNNGYIKLGMLTITPSTATFDGNVAANKISGTIDWSQISNIPASRVSGGTLSGMNLSGAGTLAGARGSIGLYGSTLDVNSNGGLMLRSSSEGIGINSETNNGVVLSSNTTLQGAAIATKSWVQSQGYLTSSSGYSGTFYLAGKTWMNFSGGRFITYG